MTRAPAPALSAAEAAIVARFDAAPVPAECDPERVETVARALHKEDPTAWACGWPCSRSNHYRRLAAAAIAALPPSPAEEAVKRVQALADEYEANGRQRLDAGKPAWPLNVARDLRAALASPAPAPQGEEGR